MDRESLMHKMYITPIITRSSLLLKTKRTFKEILIHRQLPHESQMKTIMTNFDMVVNRSADKLLQKQHSEVTLKMMLEFLDRLSISYVLSRVTKTKFEYFDVLNNFSIFLDAVSQPRPQMKFIELRLHLDVRFFMRARNWKIMVTQAIKMYESVVEFVGVETNMESFLLEIGWTKELLMSQLQMDFVRILDVWIIHCYEFYELLVMKEITILLNYILDNNLLDRYATLWYFRAIDLAEKYQERQYFTQAHYLMRAASHVIYTNITACAPPSDVAWMVKRTLYFYVKQAMYLLLFDDKIQRETTKCVEFKRLAGVKPSPGLYDKVPQKGAEVIRMFTKTESYVKELRSVTPDERTLVNIIDQWDAYFNNVSIEEANKNVQRGNLEPF